MNMTDELERLSKLHNEGTLSDEEFAKAKRKLLGQEIEPVQRDNSTNEAVDRFMSLQVVVFGIAAILFLILLFGIVLPRTHYFHHYFHP
jgi:hypothetical protein